MGNNVATLPPSLHMLGSAELGVLARIDDLCHQHEQAILAGGCPAIEELLPRAPELGPALFRELLLTELEARRRRPAPCDKREYLSRFPQFAELVEEAFTRAGGDGSTLSVVVTQGLAAELNGGHQQAPGASPAASERYVLHGELARGGMGVVHRAWDAVLEREVAIKVLHEQFEPTSGTAARRFFGEARITGQLQHPAIPPVYDLGTLPDGRPFLAMKLIEGETLDALLQRRPDPAVERSRFVAVFEQICQAVAFAHARGVIHRDLKPINVMVGRFGEVQVMDWGLAKALPPRSEAPLPLPPRSAASIPAIATAADATSDWTPDGIRASTNGATLDGSVIGTLAFMPPEQARGAIDQIDTRSDVFGLGAILAVVLTGKPPYVAGAGRGTLAMAAGGELDECFARLATCGADPELVALCKRCLHPAREQRPADGEAVAKAVAELRAAADERARQAEIERVRVTEQRKRRRVQFALVASVVGILALGGFGVALATLWQRSEKAKDSAVSALGTAEQAKGEAEQAQADAEQAEAEAKQARAEEERQRRIAEAAQEKFESFNYGRTIEVAHEEWRQNRLPMTVTLLRDVRPELCGWEWNYVHRLCNSELLTFSGHAAKLGIAVFSPDGKWVATGGDDNRVMIWDSTTGAEQVAFAGHTGPVFGIAFDPSAWRVASGGADNTVRLWDPRTGRELSSLSGHGGGVWSVAFSPDGSRLVTGSADATAKVWNPKTGEVIFTLQSQQGEVRSVSISNDGTKILTASVSGAKVWDAANGAEIQAFTGHGGWVMCGSFSPDGTKIVTGSADRLAKIWDVQSGNVLQTLEGHRTELYAAAFSPDGATVMTASHDRSIRFWDPNNGQELFTLQGHSEPIRCAAFSTDGARLVTVGDDKTARIWDSTRKPEVSTLSGGMAQVRCVAFHPDGLHLLTTSDDGTLRIWNSKTGIAVAAWKGHAGLIRTAAFNSDGSRIVTRGNDNAAVLWDAKTGAEIRRLDLAGTVSAVAVSPVDGRIAAASGFLLTIWDAESNETRHIETGHTSEITALGYSTDGTRIVTGSADNTARIWDAQTGKLLHTLSDHKQWLTSASFSPDGNRVLTGSWEGKAKLWDAQTGQEILTLSNGDTLRCAAFNGDGSRIVTAGGPDFSAKVWDAKTGAEVCMLKHQGYVICAAFSLDDSRIVTGVYEGKAMIWDSRPFLESRQQSPADCGRALSPRELAFSQLARGDLQYRHGQWTEAAASYQQSLDILEQLATSDPGGGQTQSDLYAALARLGEATRAARQLEPALASYERALDVLIRLEQASLLAPQAKPQIDLMQNRIRECRDRTTAVPEPLEAP